MLIFHLILGLLIQNIKDATILDINKAITGWLKHAGDRHERRMQKICQTKDPLNNDQLSNDSD